MNTKRLSYALLLLFSGLIYASDLTVNQDGVSITTTEQSIANDSLNLSYALLGTTVKLANIATNNNELSQSSMLQLSQDIGDMADRINTMADKIVVTQTIQSANLEMTEKNMLQAQQNLLKALQYTNSVSIEKNLQKAKATLGSAIEKEEININIATSKSREEMISNMDKTPYRYRYKCMNAIKENIYGMEKQMREEAFKNVIAKIEYTKSSTQKDMDSEEMSSVSNPGSTGGVNGMGDAGDAGSGGNGGNGGGMF